MAAKGMEFPWRRTSGTISINLDVIWGMSAKGLIAASAHGLRLFLLLRQPHPLHLALPARDYGDRKLGSIVA